MARLYHGQVSAGRSVELRYRVVDVFSARPLAGNALCVVLDPCPEPVMAAIARETNLSETTFPVVTGPSSYDVRIFTPAGELPFAGHPSLGTAWVLGPGRWEQTSPGATIVVETDGDGARMHQPVPVFERAVAQQARDALGLPTEDAPDGGAWRASAGGLSHLLVLTDAPLEGLRPDLGAVARAAGAARATTVGVVRRLGDDLLQARVFVPSQGIPEDPGTGSAAGPIAVLARRFWRTAEQVTIRQGDEVGRPCRIEVGISADGSPVVGGRVAPCAEGVFSL